MQPKPPKTFECPCGQQHRSRDTVRKHKKLIERGGKVDDRRAHKTAPENGVSDKSDVPKTPESSRIVKLDMKEEYNKMSEKIEPKDPKEKGKKEGEGESKYQCGACGAAFDAPVRKNGAWCCPGCGCEY